MKLNVKDHISLHKILKNNKNICIEKSNPALNSAKNTKTPSTKNKKPKRFKTL